MRLTEASRLHYFQMISQCELYGIPSIYALTGGPYITALNCIPGRLLSFLFVLRAIIGRLLEVDMSRLPSILIGYAALAATLLAANPISFRDRRDYTTSFNFRAAAGDLNGDGITDLLICQGGNSAMVQFGNGDGTFSPGPDYFVDFLVASPILMDLNGDGKLDLVTAFYNYPSSGLAVGLGNGDGTFQPPTLYNAGTDSEVNMLVIGDFNHDGIPDAAVLGQLGVWVYVGKGGGVFSPGVLNPVSAPEYGGISLVTADFNNDGKLDLVAGTQSGFFLLLGNGDGSFQAPLATSLGSLAGSIAGADVDGDGNPDLVITTSNLAVVSIVYGNGNGTFQRSKTASLPNADQVVVADVNGDGKPDLISNTGYVALGQGSRRFSPPKFYPNGYASVSSYTYLVLSDLRNTGHPDIVAMNFYGVYSVLLNKGNGTFTEATYVTTGGQPACPVIYDFNEDGKADMAVAASGQVLIYLGTGSSSTFFKAPASIAVPGANCLAGGDFNRDGKFDLAVTGSGASAGTVTTLLGNGDGTFTQGAVLNSSVALGEPVVADYNRDGKLDLAFTSNLITFGNGDGTFGPLSPLSTGIPPLNAFATSIAVADFNGDKAPDLAVTDPFNNAMYILLNNGHGSFTLGSFLTQPQGVAAYVIVGDVNHDGKVDLLCNTLLGDIAFYLGKGDGTFTPGNSIPVQLFLAGSLAYFDMNGDGIPDLAQVNEHSFGVFQGNADGTFQDPQWFGLGNSPFMAVPANLHGQSKTSGKPDVVVTDASGYVTVLLNTTP